MPIVTVSREYGAGGLAIGRRVAELLGAEFLDSALIGEVARRLGLPEDAVKRWDERRESLILRLLRALETAHPEYAVGGELALQACEELPNPERIGRLFREVIIEEARSENAVIVGRGGAFVLGQWPGALHVRLVAPRAARLARIQARSEIGAAEAERRLDAFDKERADYLQHHFDVDWTDPLHYALVLNTAALGDERAAQVIARAARGAA
ncbi:cytidylate kinase-like family protein [bacterium]|nr:cytidylate kinase-like family protein [bacterium]